MQQEISAFTKQLASAGADEIGQCIERLRSGGMRISETITAANPVEEYREV
ncbi:hypothetical protein NKY68_30440 [Sinorhizobium meliloti]|uniref:hypothetical protein n=1 Tax=Rhizobium meliloti TaxID=382 RepID=UPI00031DA5AF|nr:hypothetical protein [Sinorhizobium meliloti]MBP2470007.1 hypothetical protein [Sinorhizobium meliloti]MDE3763247.1 hypothetical protein [Sinorhizobium meliloti]MDE3776933.1 hypothetical protein [Sinorhizobium meliloti]MDE3793602.1 hypothetical protein [Sinorhizobium meliloti]MDE3805718.1 hypothetical protein [Sinorhizobium meliloti]